MKILKNIIAIVLSVAVLGGAAVGIGRAVTGSWDIRDWGKSNTEQTTPNGEDNETPNDEQQTTPETADNGNLVATVASEKSMRLTTKALTASDSIMTTATYGNGLESLGGSDYPTSVSVTATVEPDYVTDKSVTWSAAWKDENSTWATGKNVNDYIALSTTTENTTTISVKQAFGEQIIVTVTANSASGVSATITCDYQKKITNITAYLYGDTKKDQFDMFIDYGTDDLYAGQLVAGFPHYSVYTRDSSTYLQRVKIRYDESYINALKANMLAVNSSMSTSIFDGATTFKNFDDYYGTGSNFQFRPAFVGVAFEGHLLTCVMQVSQYYNAYIKTLQQFANNPIAYVRSEIVIEGCGVYKDLPVVYSSSALTYKAESVSANQSSITF